MSGAPTTCSFPLLGDPKALADQIAACSIARSGHPRLTKATLTGDFHDATVLRKFGDVPDDLSAL
jgi:hypothetical protein